MTEYVHKQNLQLNKIANSTFNYHLKSHRFAITSADITNISFQTRSWTVIITHTFWHPCVVQFST